MDDKELPRLRTSYSSNSQPGLPGHESYDSALRNESKWRKIRKLANGPAWIGKKY